MFGKKEPAKANIPSSQLGKSEKVIPVPAQKVEHLEVSKESPVRARLLSLEEFISGQKNKQEGCMVITGTGREGYIISYNVNGESGRIIVKRDDGMEIPYSVGDLSRLKYPFAERAISLNEKLMQYKKYAKTLGYNLKDGDIE
jgi:hypothetical protein